MKGLKKLVDRMTCHKLNNQGSTLLTVIICIAFISILGSMMLSVTITNLQMKLLESKSKKNFYSCETVMEKIRVAVQEIAAGAVKEVYENDVLTNYATYLGEDQTEINSDIQKRVIVRFMEVLGADYVPVDYDINDEFYDIDDIIDYATTKGYTVNSDYFYVNSYLAEVGSNYSVTWEDEDNLKCEKSETSPYTIRIKDVTIEYVEENYRTAITSDIIITMPDFSFTKGTNYKMDQPYKQYVLMADGTITSDNIGETTSIQGNVYSGSGIFINGQNSGSHIVNINGGVIATEGNITVSDTAALNIGGLGDHIKPVIWADNLVTSTSAAYPSDSDLNTKMTINGISAIRDDLTLDGRNSNVVLNGAYIGYTGAHTTEGSSMIVNGSSSSLDLKDLKELILAGRANVSVEDIDLNKDTDILTGESIALKSNQRAYLLPSKFIMDINHNPVTQEDYAGNTMPVITINDTDELIKYNKYVFAANPYKIAAKQTGGTILRYYYLNFLRGWKADSYLTEFNSKYIGFLNNMEPFSIDALILPEDGEIYTVGNLSSYDADDGGLKLTAGMSSLPAYAGDVNAVYDDGAELSFDNDLDDAVAGITLVNTVDNTVYSSTMVSGKTVGSLNSVYYDSFDTVASTITTGGVNSIIDNTRNNGLGLSSDKFNDYYTYDGNADYKNFEPSKKSLWVIDGDITISQPDDPGLKPIFNGIMIATGDITVSDNAKINGILISPCENGSATVTVGNNVNLNGRIITVGDIYLGQHCNLSAVGTTDTDFDNNIFIPETEILKYLFRNTKLTVDFTSNSVDLSSMISYENWRRIE